jgi:hypothetical protein
MAEQIRIIECKLDKYRDGLENHYITQTEYNELTSALGYELHLLAKSI